MFLISKVEDAYKCMALTDYGNEQVMENFDIQDGKIIASYDSQGTLVEVSALLMEMQLPVPFLPRA